ncbi:MAG TPA: twin-arginine translocation signal domain-containing protein [Oligoflexus sp.]|uniref:twin-arginine translocation signal domain-containing protein n=1 Tax=Oligoflexus sp. TaxID=1971216 RepID=UPI002D4FFAA5|nr:twin-arginine translocation signal domain-containing protein [Oligoflexus sp.]HYX34490.1 twin-arginine translocation signal domain-containing protein [Oligoflexus sp.]
MSHKKSNISRRDLIKLTAGTTGAMAIGGMVPGIMTPEALAQSATQSAVLVVFLPGGYNALFSSADSFSGAGTFGVTAANMLNLGGGLVVDNSFNTLGAFAKANMASVGVAHGIAAHGGAKTAQFSVNNLSPVLSLAAGMGGSGSIKAANVGAEMVPGPQTAVSGTSLQQITDMKSTIDALGGGAPDPTMPKREIAAKGITAAEIMSLQRLQGNPESLSSMTNGYKAAFDTLSKAAQPFNAQELMTAYGLTGTAVTDMRAKFAAAELMIRSGANVVTASAGGGLSWDTHGDTSGARARQKFIAEIMPGLKVFTDRMVTATSNVTVVIFGDFARSLPGSDHASVTSATVIGPNVKLGTTGKVDANVGLPAGTPGVNGLWGLVSALAKAPTSVVQGFGGNPHTAISKV